jgi:hypothetical protein
MSQTCPTLAHYPSVWLIFGKGAVMRIQRSEAPPSVLAFAPRKGLPDTIVADDTGHSVVALLQRAADMAKSECDRATALAHRLSFEIRAAEERAHEFEADARAAEERAREFEAEAKAAEERARVFEAEANHFRDRAARAEAWLSRIQSEVEQIFFQSK